MITFGGIFGYENVTAPAQKEKELQIIRLGPGIHTMKTVLLDKPHALLEGVGRGITILLAPEGVLCTDADPVIRGLTIVGSGTGSGLILRNTWSAQIQDVEIESYLTGIAIELTEDGRRSAMGSTLRGWPSALTPNPYWGSRVTLTELRNVEITGHGDGIVLHNMLKDGNKGLNGEFFTATTIWGGHIAVQGRSVVIGNNVWNTKIIGTYIDVGIGGGIYMEKDAWDLVLVGVTLDRNKTAREAGSPKVVAASRKAAKSIRYETTTLEDNEIIEIGK